MPRAMPLLTVPATLALVLALGGCASDDGGTPAGASPSGTDAPPSPSGDDGPAEPATTTGSPTDEQGAGEDIAVVSLSPTATELLFAIGAGDAVVAADEFSDFPPEAPTTELSGFEPNVESILEFEPDVVVASFDPGDLVDQLEAADVEVLLQPTATSLDDTYAQALELGEATGTTDGAEQLVDDLMSSLEELADPSLGAGLTYYHEISGDLFTATSATFVGEVYGLFGLENIADDAPDEFAMGFPQLSVEYLVEADPDLVFLACTELCDITPTSFAERDGLDRLAAVETGDVVALDDDVAGRWGPRVVEYAGTVRDALEARDAG